MKNRFGGICRNSAKAAKAWEATSCNHAEQIHDQGGDLKKK